MAYPRVQRFLERFTAARRSLATSLAALGIRHVEFVLDQPPDAPLRQLFGPASSAGTALERP